MAKNVFKRLKPNPERDNFTELLNCASLLARKEIIKYLLEAGAQPNDKANGASTVMDHCLSHLSHEDLDAFLYKHRISRWGVRRTMKSLRELVRHGAVWQPNDSSQMDSVRRTLYRAEPEVTMDLLELNGKLG